MQTCSRKCRQYYSTISRFNPKPAGITPKSGLFYPISPGSGLGLGPAPRTPFEGHEIKRGYRPRCRNQVTEFRQDGRACARHHVRPPYGMDSLSCSSGKGSFGYASDTFPGQRGPMPLIVGPFGPTPRSPAQTARSPMRSILRLPTRPVRRPMTLRAVGLRAASSVLALERARHRHPCRTTRRHPAILHRRPSGEGRGSGFRSRAPPPPCGRRDHRCQCLHPSPTAPRGHATIGTGGGHTEPNPVCDFMRSPHLVAFGISHSVRRFPELCSGNSSHLSQCPALPLVS